MSLALLTGAAQGPTPADAATPQLVASHPALIPLPVHVEWRDGFLSANQAMAETIHHVHVAGLPPKGYEIEIVTNGAFVRSSSDAGDFYTEQTLKQLRAADGSLPCVAIRDEPRFPWRGMMLDASRHFQSKEYVERYIDLMAAFKLNVFHYISIRKFSSWGNEPNFIPPAKFSSYPRRGTGEQAGPDLGATAAVLPHERGRPFPPPG